MRRWGYIVVAPDPADKRPRPPVSAWVIKPTRAGRKAKSVWEPLSGTIEERWKTRFGNDKIDRLRESLVSVIRQTDDNLPDCLPILGYGFFAKEMDSSPVGASPLKTDPKQLELPALLARVLLKFTIDFENESKLSLAICANVVRVLDERGVPIRALPSLAGVSKEAISSALGVLEKRGVAIQAIEPGTRTRVARLTETGQRVFTEYIQRLAEVEALWQRRFGPPVIEGLRKSCEDLAGKSGLDPSPLFQGLEPYPDGWRAAVPRASTLPHYPMVLHRGGFPDGS